MSDKPLESMSTSELQRLCEGYEFLLQRIRDLSGQLLADWDAIPESQRRERVRRAFAPSIINPRPVDAATLAGLMALLSAEPAS